jgi:hypothetical protein
MEVTDVLKAGRNELEIKVVNQWANRLIGDGIDELRPSGLFGPVRLMTGQ